MPTLAVMEHFPATLTRPQSDALVERIEACFVANGFGLWAVEVLGQERFIGFVGLWPVDALLPFAPAVELGWRLSKAHWGRGYALEAAGAAAGFGLRRAPAERAVA